MLSVHVSILCALYLSALSQMFALFIFIVEHTEQQQQLSVWCENRSDEAQGFSTDICQQDHFLFTFLFCVFFHSFFSFWCCCWLFCSLFMCHCYTVSGWIKAGFQNGTWVFRMLWSVFFHHFIFFSFVLFAYGYFHFKKKSISLFSTTTHSFML